MAIKKSKSQGPFWSCQLNSTANSTHLGVNRLNWQCCLAGSTKTDHRILIFFQLLCVKMIHLSFFPLFIQCPNLFDITKYYQAVCWNQKSEFFHLSNGNKKIRNKKDLLPQGQPYSYLLIGGYIWMKAERQLEGIVKSGFCINKELFFKPFESFCMFFIRPYSFRVNQKQKGNSKTKQNQH